MTPLNSTAGARAADPKQAAQADAHPGVQPNPADAAAGASPAAAAAPAAGAAGSADKTKPELSSLFTTLLVAQIKNQDPLSPTDSSQFVNQLTQLSQVESLHAMSSQGAASNHILASLQAFSLGSQVGQVAQVQVDRLQLDDKPVQTSFTLPTDTAATSLVLTGADGVEHRTEIGRLDKGEHDYLIDPKTLGLAPGAYTVRMEDAAKQAVPVEARAEVTGVRLGGDGGAMVQMGPLGEFSSQLITQFRGRPGASRV